MQVKIEKEEKKKEVRRSKREGRSTKILTDRRTSSSAQPESEVSHKSKRRRTDRRTESESATKSRATEKGGEMDE